MNMKRFLAVAVFALAAASLSAGQTGDKKANATASEQSKIEQSLMQIEREWIDALLKKDTAKLGQMLGDRKSVV